MRSFVPCLLVAAQLAHPAAAQLACPQPQIDLGDQRSGVALKARFTLTNQGTDALTITAVKPGCGCIKAAIDRKALKPGEHAVLDAEVQTVTQPAGANSWRILVRTRQGATDNELSLTLAARLTRDLYIQPASLVVETASARTHTFTLTERRDKPLRTGAYTSSPHAQVRLGTPRRIGDVWQRAIDLDLPASAPSGTHEGVICLRTDDAACPELTVPFKLVKHAANQVTASPAMVEQILPAKGSPPAKMILLSTPEGSPVLVDRVEPAHPCIRCTFAEGPGPRSTLRVQVQREKLPAERFESCVRVILRQPEGAVITVPVSVVR